LQKARPVNLERRAWTSTPAELFGELAHLPCPLFLDTAGNLPHAASSPHSIIGADPEEIITGSIFDPGDLAVLDEGLKREQISAPDCGLPLGGWFGTIDYEGEFWFGNYRNLLIYSHESAQWMEVGGDVLSQQRRQKSVIPLPELGSWSSNFTREQFEQRVLRAQDYIAAGDIYQVNLAQRFQTTVSGDSILPFYDRLRSVSPAPMAAYLKTGERELLSSSPELFLRLSGNRIQTRPIKGTRPRFKNPDDDLRASHELQMSEKEQSELLMITDLLRNDLGRICELGSVEVEALAQLETLAQVHHLASTISGTLRNEITHPQAVVSCSPGGSITGAPKKRAREIITELEGLVRGLYTGSIGYFGYNGESQFSIVIRTLIREGNLLHYHVGAGIVADSLPGKEYDETLHKAEGLRLALEPQ